MPGMGHPLQTDNTTITAAFRSALNHQLLILVVLGVLVVLAWNLGRTLQYRRAVAAGARSAPAPIQAPYPEPAARRFLRITFGLLWLLDGLLQLQGAMPVGLPGSVMTPAASSSPGWVQHLVNVGVTIWSNHPVTAATAAVWIQLGLGIFLLVAPRGYWSRAAGATSVGWGLVVWVFGEAFGGIFGHGSSWLFGLPGGVLFYVVAGVLVALPETSWGTARLGKGVLRGMGAFFVGMGVLQAWPGRGSWSGAAHAQSSAGSLTTMVTQMSQVPQPSAFASWVRAFASFQAGHGWLVNFVIVVLLVGVGGAFLSGNLRVVRVGVIVGAVFCLATWVLIQDFGFFGGLGTDPNSMVPIALLFTGGYLAMARFRVRAPATEAVPAAEVAGSGTVAAPTGFAGWIGRVNPTYLLRALLAVLAVAIVLVGAAPMAVAATNPDADPILIQAANGPPTLVDAPAPPFTLTDTRGHSVSLTSLTGRTVVLTFLDPVCTSDCPEIAQSLRLADENLGAEAQNVELVAVANNPLYLSTALTAAFDRQEGLDRVANWTYLTGSLAQLDQVWNDYGVQTEISPAGGMVAHSDVVYVIDKQGRTRVILNGDPGQGSTESSFVGQLTTQINNVLHS
ncbi:MAG TPA: SCO family protein [Acidimicrobiales bacterium]|nr:SCO family protein [Acidimicrobiales bacterium]